MNEEPKEESEVVRLRKIVNKFTSEQAVFTLHELLTIGEGDSLLMSYLSREIDWTLDNI